MINMIEKLYLGFINEVNRTKFTKNDINKYGRNDAYDKLKATLSQEQFILLDTYLEKIAMESSDIVKQSYIQGFKTGLLIGIETTNIELE